jgi:cytochrome c peroxidase
VDFVRCNYRETFMSNASSRELVPGTIGKPNIITRGLMLRGRRPSSLVQTESKRWWLLTAATWAALASGEVGAQQPANRALIEEGRHIFFEEEFGGNGRTCGTCHPATHNFTIDADFIAPLDKDDPCSRSQSPGSRIRKCSRAG